VFLVLIVAVIPSQVFADKSFPHDGATLTYALTTTGQAAAGSILAFANDSYEFSTLGDGWNVTETFTGKITCSPSSATLSVKYQTTSDIMGQNAAASNNPNIRIQVSYVVKDRIVESTSIGPNVPADYIATCNFGGNNIASIAGGTAALYAFGFKFYVFIYIQPAGIGLGSTVPVSIMAATISGTQNLQVAGESRAALVGTLSGFATGNMYWDSTSGILLLAKLTSVTQTDQMQLVESPGLAP
jgi:hypothetical protein